MAEGLGRRQISEALNRVFGGSPDTTPAGIVWISLWELDPGDDGQSGTEASGGGYARVSVTAADWNNATLATPSVVNNANDITFPTASADWNAGASFTHFAIHSDAALSTEAVYIGRGALNTAQPVLNGQTPKFSAGDLSMDGTQTP